MHVRLWLLLLLIKRVCALVSHHTGLCHCGRLADWSFCATEHVVFHLAILMHPLAWIEIEMHQVVVSSIKNFLFGFNQFTIVYNRIQFPFLFETAMAMIIMIGLDVSDIERSWYDSFLLFNAIVSRMIFHFISLFNRIFYFLRLSVGDYSAVFRFSYFIHKRITASFII